MDNLWKMIAHLIDSKIQEMVLTPINKLRT
jgi:hypothetical protein